MRSLDIIEKEREDFQVELDATQSVEARRALGQFATPLNLAREITSFGLSLLDNNTFDFLEPSIGTGAFFSALQYEKNKKCLNHAYGIEIDKRVIEKTKLLWDSQIQLLNKDYTEINEIRFQADLVLSNPPYVRHHLLSREKKVSLASAVFKELGISVSGLSGLYCYFLLLTHKWLKPNAISGWLIPSEFMDVNYGSCLKQYLLTKVQLLRIHRYEPDNTLFKDALVSSCVVWFKNVPPDKEKTITFTYGGTHDSPFYSKQLSHEELKTEKKWTRFPCKALRNSTLVLPVLGDFFKIKRGIATGDNKLFILDKQFIQDNKLGFNNFTPILPSPRHLNITKIEADENGWPVLPNQLFVLSTQDSESVISKNAPELWKYLEEHKKEMLTKYICKNRKCWYFQEHREPAYLLCTYMGRGNSEQAPFKFILNKSKAIVTNTYLMLYVKDEYADCIASVNNFYEIVWSYLSNISSDAFENEGRIYGGGLRKIEPKELAQLPCPQISSLFSICNKSPKQLSLFK